MPPPTDRLYTLARATLDAVVAGWPGDATALPERQYVSNGIVIWDCCEQLAVQVERTFGYEGDVTTEALSLGGAGFAMRGATMGVWLIRQVVDLADDGTGGVIIPSADEIDDDAAVILGDADALLNVLVAAQKAGELASCTSLAFEDWQGQGPEGGYGGGVLRLRMGLI